MSAKALGIEAERGRIAAGQFADLTIVDGHPDVKISDIEKTFAVFRNGGEVNVAALRATAASHKPVDLSTVKIPAEIDRMESSDGRDFAGHASGGQL